MLNRCDCPNPPGGTVTCAPDHFAYCMVVRGKIRTGCYKPRATAIKSAGSSEMAFVRHVSRAIPRKYVSEFLQGPSEVLNTQFFESRDGGFQLSFKLPYSRNGNL